MNIIWIWIVDSNYNSVKDAHLEAFTDFGQQKSKREQLDLSLSEDKDRWDVYAKHNTTVRININAPGYDNLSHTVKVRDEITQVVIGLGKNGEISYSYGDNRLAFSPNDKQFLLSVSGQKALARTARILKSAKLENHLAIPDSPQESDSVFQIVEGKIEEVEAIAAKLRDKETVAEVLRIIQHGKRAPLGLSNELVVRFKGDLDRREAEKVAATVGMKLKRRLHHAGNGYVLEANGLVSYDILKAADELLQMGVVEYVEPNLRHHLELDAYTPNDPLFAQTPHLTLVGADEAWDQLDNVTLNLRGGSPDIAIAVIDPNGVAPNHPDLTANLTDGTSKMVTSMNFRFTPIAAETGAGMTGDHGTQCAGSATAAFDDSRGIPGVAPNCHLLGARNPDRTNAVEMSDTYMWLAGFFNGSVEAGFPTSLPAQPADILTSSYGSTGLLLSNTMRDLFDFLSTYGRNGKGCVVLWSLGNSGYGDFTVPTGTRYRAWPTYNRCLGVGSSINTNPTNPLPSTNYPDPTGDTTNVPAVVDTRSLFSPYGATNLRKPDLVCPSHSAYISTGGIYDPIMSTVRVGSGAVDGCNPGTCNDYDLSFGGTSHSTPATAGAVGLILSARPSLNWIQVRDILRQSCARIDAAQANAIGVWQDLDADGAIDYSRWYGAGRLDVGAAVNLALDGSRPLADIYVRENLSDNGDVPSGGAWYASPDIWVSQDPTTPIPALLWGSAPPHENASGGQDNAVFCRVRNRGLGVATEVNVRAMVTHWAGLEFVYPDDFQPTNNVGAPVPNPLVPGTYLIGDQTVTNLSFEEDQIVKFNWPAALVPPETVIVGTATVHWHPCLLLEASPHDGPDAIDGLARPVQGNNNIAQRNITISYADSDSAAYTGMIVGSRDKAGVATLVIDPERLDGLKLIRLHISDERGMKQLVSSAMREARRQTGNQIQGFENSIVLEERTKLRFNNDRFGSFLEASPGTRIMMGLKRRSKFQVSVGSYKGLQVVEFSDIQERIELPLRLEAGQFVPLLVSVEGNPQGDLLMTQRRGDGELSGGYGIQFSKESIKNN